MNRCPKIYRSLTFKLGLSVLAIELAVLAITGWNYTHQFGEEVDRNRIQGAQVLGQLVARGLLSYNSLLDTNMLHELLGELPDEGMVFDVNGNIYHSIHAEQLGRSATNFLSIPLSRLREISPDGAILSSGEAAVLEYCQPLVVAGNQATFLYAYFKIPSTSALAAKRQIAGRFLWGSVVALAVTSLAIILLVHRLVLRPVRLMRTVLDRFAEGDLQARVTEKRAQDEIGGLQHGVNSMGEKLAQTFSALQQKIDQLRTAEAELERQKGFLSRLVENIPVAVMVKNPAHDFRYEFVNERAALLFRKPATEILGQDDSTLLPADLARSQREHDKRSLEQREPVETLEEWPAASDNRICHLRAMRVPVSGAAGAPEFLLVVAEDITAKKKAQEERNRLENQLRQAQKMESIGTLAGGVAHDFNNILAAIIPNAHLAKADARDNESVQECLDEILAASERARRLVQQILAFSRCSPQERRPMQLEPLVKEGLKLLRSALPTTIDITTKIQPGLPAVVADPTQMHQVLVNLGTNAGHAMRDRPGNLEVQLALFTIDAHSPPSEPQLPPGEYVRLSVGDNGHGISEENLKRIFEPFFTTKTKEEGTGLGLAVVHGIVHDHQGAIQVYSKADRGTVFHIYLPACSAPAAEAASADTILPRGNGEHILFVDDEKALCDVAQKVLQASGYRVSVYQSPHAALSEFRSAPHRFNLAVTDLTMPGMTGIDLSLHLLAARPGFPIILATGFGGAWTPETVRRVGLREVIAKPVSPRELVSLIHRTLAC